MRQAAHITGVDFATRAGWSDSSNVPKVEKGLDADLDDAVAERMDRQTALNRPGTGWLFLMEEWVLYLRPFGLAVHAGQLRHLLEVMRRPNISVGVIPASVGRRTIHPAEAFDIIDSQFVMVELVSGFLQVTTPSDVAMYEAKWDRLRSLAAFNDAAGLVERALAGLEGQEGA